MNRLSAMVLALAMISPVSGCSETDSNTEPNEIAAAVSAADSSLSSAEVTEKKLPDISTGEDSSSDSSREILTPAVTEAQAFINTKYTDYSYFSKAQEYDCIDKVRYPEMIIQYARNNNGCITRGEAASLLLIIELLIAEALLILSETVRIKSRLHFKEGKASAQSIVDQCKTPVGCVHHADQIQVIGNIERLISVHKVNCIFISSFIAFDQH